MEKKVYSVTQINSYIRNMFAQDFVLNAISVRGEASNVKYHSSGHLYFTLKDEGAAVACVMFAGSRSGLSFQLREGQKIVVSGSVDVYERDGKYQLYAKKIRLDGEGDLYSRFLRMKNELEEMGMFAGEYKQPIPGYIRTLGVVTAPTGAAIRDIINIAKRRNPYVQIILYPAIVQGDQAVASIAAGIRALDALKVDVMIVGRGGGSIEDLWAFNEREVAQAVFDCFVPVISAVGHETDTTIIDYVADRRAPTPSAAAELAVYEHDRLMGEFAEYAEALERSMCAVLDKYKMRAENYLLKLQKASPVHQIREQRMRLMTTQERLSEAMSKKMREARHRMELYMEKMNGLSPLLKLSQGYAYVSDAQGRTLSSIDQVKEGDAVSIFVKDGIASAKVGHVRKVRIADE